MNSRQLSVMLGRKSAQEPEEFLIVWNNLRLYVDPEKNLDHSENSDNKKILVCIKRFLTYLKEATRGDSIKSLLKETRKLFFWYFNSYDINVGEIIKKTMRQVKLVDIIINFERSTDPANKRISFQLIHYKKLNDPVDDFAKPLRFLIDFVRGNDMKREFFHKLQKVYTDRTGNCLWHHPIWLQQVRAFQRSALRKQLAAQRRQRAQRLAQLRAQRKIRLIRLSVRYHFSPPAL